MKRRQSQNIYRVEKLMDDNNSNGSTRRSFDLVNCLFPCVPNDLIILYFVFPKVILKIDVIKFIIILLAYHSIWPTMGSATTHVDRLMEN